MTTEQKNLLRGAALAVLVGVAVYFVAIDVFDAPKRSASATLQVGAPAPTFSLPSIRGDGTIDLAQFRGKGVMLTFWATWCDSCKKELPVLDRIHRDLGGDDFQILTVAGEPRGDLLRFVDAKGYALPVASDGGQVHIEYGVDGLPRTVLIGPDGNVIEDIVGPLAPSKLMDAAKRLQACARAARSGAVDDPWCGVGAPKPAAPTAG